METLFRKLPNGKYQAVTTNVHDSLGDGIWVVQHKDLGKSLTSLVWLVGDLKRPADVTTHAAIQSMSSKLTRYIMQIQEPDSKEFHEAQEMLGGYLRGPVQIGNISAADITKLFLRKIALLIEDDAAKTK
jgi:hypothetical protein